MYVEILRLYYIYYYILLLFLYYSCIIIISVCMDEIIHKIKDVIIESRYKGTFASVFAYNLIIQ